MIVASIFQVQIKVKLITVTKLDKRTYSNKNKWRNVFLAVYIYIYKKRTWGGWLFDILWPNTRRKSGQWRENGLGGFWRWVNMRNRVRKIISKNTCQMHVGKILWKRGKNCHLMLFWPKQRSQFSEILWVRHVPWVHSSYCYDYDMTL